MDEEEEASGGTGWAVLARMRPPKWCSAGGSTRRDGDSDGVRLSAGRELAQGVTAEWRG